MLSRFKVGVLMTSHTFSLWRITRVTEIKVYATVVILLATVSSANAGSVVNGRNEHYALDAGQKEPVQVYELAEAGTIPSAEIHQDVPSSPPTEIDREVSFESNLMTGGDLDQEPVVTIDMNETSQRWRFGGRLQYDAANVDSDARGSLNESGLRRSRLSVTGQLTNKWRLKLDYEFRDGEAEPRSIHFNG